VRPDIPLDRLTDSVAAVTGQIKLDPDAGVRLPGAIRVAVERAFDACDRRDCAACDRIWKPLGMSCEQRRVRKLAKRLVLAFLPLLRRGNAFESVTAALDSVAARALGHDETVSSALKV
jgi:hypothetical protein